MSCLNRSRGSGHQSHPSNFTGSGLALGSLDVISAVTALEVARFHGNVWTDMAGSWLPPGAWQACAGDAPIKTGERVWVGVDIGGERAATAVVGVTEDLRVGSRIFEGDGAILAVKGSVEELAEKFEIVELCHAPWRAQQLALELER